MIGNEVSDMDLIEIRQLSRLTGKREPSTLGSRRRFRSNDSVTATQNNSLDFTASLST